MKSAQRFILTVLCSQFMRCAYMNFTRMISIRLTTIRMEWQWSLAGSRSNSYWRAGRRMIDRSLRPVATASYRPMIQARAHVCLARLLENPHQWEDHIDLSVTFLSNWHQFLNYLANVQPSRGVDPCCYIWISSARVHPSVRHIPEWLPWFSYKKIIRVGRELGKQVKYPPIQFVKESMVSNYLF